MKKRNRNLLIPALILIGVVVLITQIIVSRQTAVKENNEQTDTRQVATEELTGNTLQNSATNKITVDLGDSRVFSLEKEVKTPYEALQIVARENNLEIIVKEYKYGLMVEGVADKENTRDYFWMYSVNGEAGRIAGNRHILKLGDSVEWKYTKS